MKMYETSPKVAIRAKIKNHTKKSPGGAHIRSPRDPCPTGQLEIWQKNQLPETRSCHISLEAKFHADHLFHSYYGLKIKTSEDICNYYPVLCDVGT